MKIVFMGTPDFSVGSLEALIKAGHEITAVVTQPDKQKGRSLEMSFSPVKECALKYGIPVFQPERIKRPEAVETLKTFEADIFVVVAFGQILSKEILDMPKYGCINVHASLLPKYRGAAPINWAVINGEVQTGVTTFFLDHDIDTGRIIMQDTFDIHDDYNVENVYDGLMELGANLALKTIDKMLEGDGHVESMAQSDMVASSSDLHSAPKIFKDTCNISWNQPVKKVYDFIRGLSPVPGAWTAVLDDKGKEYVLKIYKAAKTEIPSDGGVGLFTVDQGRLLVNASDYKLQLEVIQLSGKKRMEARDFLNGKDVSGWKVKL